MSAPDYKGVANSEGDSDPLPVTISITEAAPLSTDSRAPRVLTTGIHGPSERAFRSI